MATKKKSTGTKKPPVKKVEPKEKVKQSAEGLSEAEHGQAWERGESEPNEPAETGEYGD